jgi:signal transduction histidine kinase
VDRTHPDDREHVRRILDRASVERDEFTAEHRLLMPDGSVKHVRAVAHFAAGADPGRFVFVGAVMDISERKRAEQERERLRQLETDLAYMNRVSMMGELAASLAHEIKQPIAAAALNGAACTNWLRRDAPDLAKASSSATAMVANVMLAGSIIDRVSSLYRRGTPAPESIDLNEIVLEMSALLAHMASRNAVSIRTELDPELPATTADRVQLQQVLMNLMVNGVEAMQNSGGELIVASSQTGDGQLLISVSDSGVGLSVDQAERIFEAFVTTKPQGTGMGLSISRRIIASHGGRLWANPNTGRGTTFQFMLPVAASAVLRVVV